MSEEKFDKKKTILTYVSKHSDKIHLFVQKTVYKCLSEVNNAVKKSKRQKIIWYTFQNILREIHLFVKKNCLQVFEKRK